MSLIDKILNRVHKGVNN